MTAAPALESGATEINLDIGGMTCASCAARIEKKLNRIDGVTASVNYATEKAKVTYTDAVTPADLIAQVEATGYTARVPSQPPPTLGPNATSTTTSRAPFVSGSRCARCWPRR